jgi:interferon gamma-inducible protein 30
MYSNCLKKFGDNKIEKLANNNTMKIKNVYPLKIEILIESLCPDCINFFDNSFSQFLEAMNYSDIANIILYPYGNAKEVYDKESGKWKFTCQHGPNECYGNMIQACIIKKHPNKHISFNLVKCIYENLISNKKNFDLTLKKCVIQNIKNDDSQNKFTDEVNKCANGKEGNDYMYEISQKYKEHKHVPWIVVNGERTLEMEKKAHDNLLKFSCEYAKNDIKSCKNIINNEYFWEKFDYNFIQKHQNNLLKKQSFCLNK